MITAKDIMTKDVIYVHKDVSACEAARLLVEHDIAGMPVVEDDMTVLGVITEKDLLRLYTSRDNASHQAVQHFMSHPPVWYREDETFDKIYYFMLLNYFRRIPVVSPEGKLVGVISRRDVLRHILAQTNSCESACETVLEPSRAAVACGHPAD